MRPRDSVFLHHVRRDKNTRADSLANHALDVGHLREWLQPGLSNLLGLLCKQQSAWFVQGRFDGALRRKSQKASIGVSLELVVDAAIEPLFVLASDVQCKDSYEAEMMAARALIEHVVQLYTKFHMACCENL